MLVAQSCLILVTPWTVACHVPLSVGCPRQEQLEWVAISFSRGSFYVSHIAGRFFTSEPPGKSYKPKYSAYVSLPVPTQPLTATDLMDCSLSVSCVCGILQARILEWVTMPFSRGSSLSRGWTRVLCLLCWQAGPLPLVPSWKPIVSMVFPLPECHIVGIIQNLGFSNWLLSLGNIHLIFIHVFLWLVS